MTLTKKVECFYLYVFSLNECLSQVLSGFLFDSTLDPAKLPTSCFVFAEVINAIVMWLELDYPSAVWRWVEDWEFESLVMMMMMDDG